MHFSMQNARTMQMESAAAQSADVAKTDEPLKWVSARRLLSCSARNNNHNKYTTNAVCHAARWDNNWIIAGEIKLRLFCKSASNQPWRKCTCAQWVRFGLISSAKDALWGHDAIICEHAKVPWMRCTIAQPRNASTSASWFFLSSRVLVFFHTYLMFYRFSERSVYQKISPQQRFKSHHFGGRLSKNKLKVLKFC